MLEHLASTTRTALRRRVLWLLPASLLAASLGCSGNNTYPFDYFPEMHYQSTHRFQEPPRPLGPSDSVPVTGKEVPYTLADAENLRNPVTRNQPNLAAGKRLYEVNCAVCHGVDAKGATTVASRFQKAGVAPPINLTRPETQRLLDGVIFTTLTNGRGNMPPFRHLLTEEERWKITLHIRNLPSQ